MRSVRVYQYPEEILSEKELEDFVIVYNIEEADLIISNQYNRDVEMFLSKNLDVISIEINSFYYNQLEVNNKTDLLKVVTELYPYIVNKIELDESIISKARKQPLLSLLLYTWIKDKVIKPIFNYKTSQGYYYPITMNFDELGLMLNELVRLQCLEPEVVEVGYQCPSCSSVHLLIRDCCEYCHSVSIKDASMIHHFSCSYVGREDLFDKGYGIYKCPKCNKELKQIGLDYDKPGTLVYCKTCHKDSTESVVGCHCLNCDKKFLIDDAVNISIYQYLLTSQGINDLLSGRIITIGFKEYVSGEVGFQTPEIFYAVLERMRALKERDIFDSYVLVIDLSRLEFNNSYKEKLSLYKTLTHELKLTLRSTDCLLIEDNVVFILLSNVPEENVDFALKRFKKTINSVISKSLAKEIKYRKLDIQSFCKSGLKND